MRKAAMRASAPLLSAPLIVMVTMALASCSECSKYATFMPLTGGPTAGNFAHPRPAERRRRREPCRQSVDSDGKFYPNVMPRTRPSVTGDHDAYTRLHRWGQQGARPDRFGLVPPRKERTMKTNKFRLLSVAGLAVSAILAAAPVLAHDGYRYGHVRYGAPYFAHPGHRVVVVRPAVVYPVPVYYAPAPVYYAAPVYPAPIAAATVGGAIAGAAIGGIVSHGRPGAIVAGSLIGAVVGNGLAR